MGKRENIKRARKLKEAKRRREQLALTAQGMGPAGQVLKEKYEADGKAIQPNRGPVKYSKLLEAIVNPIIKQSDDVGIAKTKYIFGSFAWNAAILKGIREEQFLLAKRELAPFMEGIPEAEMLFDEMVEVKLQKFAEYRDLIVDVEIRKIGGGHYDLSVVRNPFPG